MGLKFPIIYLKFLDHCSGPGNDINPIECEVFGALIKQDKDAYYVASWLCEGKADNHNTEVFAILKNTILKKRILK